MVTGRRVIACPNGAKLAKVLPKVPCTSACMATSIYLDLDFYMPHNYNL